MRAQGIAEEPTADGLVQQMIGGVEGFQNCAQHLDRELVQQVPLVRFSTAGHFAAMLVGWSGRRLQGGKAAAGLQLLISVDRHSICESILLIGTGEMVHTSTPPLPPYQVSCQFLQT